MEQVASQIIPFCGEWLLVITRTIRRHNVVGEGRRLNILQYADITPCLPDQWGPMNMLLGKDKYTTHNQTCRKEIWWPKENIYNVYNTCRQGIICCLKMNGLLYISNVAQAMLGQTEGGYSRRNDLVITKLHLDKDIHSHFLFLFLHYKDVLNNKGWWKKMKNTPPFDDRGLY